MDIKPTNFLTITPKWTFATGTPKSEFGPTETTNVQLPTEPPGHTLTMYTRSRFYNEDIRTKFEMPFDLKIAFHFYFPKSKIRFEIYTAVEDLFVFLYEPSYSTIADKYTGEEIIIPDGFLPIPIPVPSIGIKINF